MKKIVEFVSVMMVLMLIVGCGTKTSTENNDSHPTVSTDASKEANNEINSNDPFADAPTLKLTFAENQPGTSSIGLLAEEFIANVAEASNNTIQIEFYPDGMLGDEVTVIGMIEANTVDFTRVNLASLQSTIPEVGVLTLPYIYKDAEHANRVLESEVGQDILAKTKEHGFVGLRYLKSAGDGDFRCFYSDEPIRSLSDLAGKKIRVQESEVVISMVKALGAVPTPMAFGEVFQSLQTGVVDIAENPLMAYYLVGHYEVAPYFTYDKHQISPNMYIMSQNTYDSMTDAQLEVFTKYLDKYIEDMTEVSIKDNEKYKKLLLEAGVELIDIDITEFQEAVKPMYDSYPEYSEYLEKIYAIE